MGTLRGVPINGVSYRNLLCVHRRLALVYAPNIPNVPDAVSVKELLEFLRFGGGNDKGAVAFYRH